MSPVRTLLFATALSAIPLLAGCGKPREDSQVEDLGSQEERPKYREQFMTEKQKEELRGQKGAPQKQNP